MTSPIIDFIEARLKADQEAAEAAGGGRWSTDQYDSVVDEQDETVIYDGYRPSHLHVEHILRHDPARVLREVAAKREIVADSALAIEKYAGGMYLDYVWHVLKLLAATWSDHPDFDPNWSTT